MKRIYLSPPCLDGSERQLLMQAFDSNWITTLGPHVDAFEREMCKKLGIRYAVALSSGTAALHLALLVLGVRRGDEVLCSTLTFAATANAISYCGAIPVFIDSNRSTWNMDPELLEEEMAEAAQRGRLPKAVIVVDIYGQCAEYRPILEICSRYEVPVIEDAAEALGASYGEKMAGTFGVSGILSFNGNKIITTSGGGMLVSNSKQLIEQARFLSTQSREPVPYYHHTCIGYNYRLSNLLAAIGRSQLELLEKKVTKKRTINQFYRDALKDIPGVEFMPEIAFGHSTFWLTCITIDPEQCRVTAEDMRLHLESHNIESRPAWKPMHLQPVFRQCRIRGGSVSEDLFVRGLCLPSGCGITEAELSRVVHHFSALAKKRSRKRVAVSTGTHVA